VNQILELLGSRLDHRDRGALVAVVREVLGEQRAGLLGTDHTESPGQLAEMAARRLETLSEVGVRHVINATGVVLHTNLGRAPWADAAIRAAMTAARGYVFLELDPETGRRAERFRLVESHLVALTGAEAALSTNNNAAALALSLSVVGRNRGVAVARGELAEIGGGVRIPDLVRRAGVRLVEVGTTNRTRVADFDEALAGGARGVLRIHASNYRVEGFTERPSLTELVKLARGHRVPLIEDLGSGALIETRTFGLAHEPLPSESIAAGVDLVTFSGDKLLGGPQSGLIVGTRAMVERLRRDPLARAVRLDKAMLAGLATTLALYRSGEAADAIPIWRMIGATVPSLRRRARAISAAVRESTGQNVAIVRSEATVGGGSLPGEVIPSVALSLRPPGIDRAHRRLRTGNPAVIGRVQGGSILLDLRTVLPEEDESLTAALVGLVEGLA
jgi:L-seryl-tRNA(Ser) seleniumtransferase